MNDGQHRTRHERLPADDWDAGRIVVTSPKTEHHPGKGSRVIPLFAELRPILAEAFGPASEGAVYMVDERMRASAQGNAGWRNCNLRTQFERIIRRAGLTLWPWLFHNLRSSRQTELAEQFPSHVVCDWLGNSEDVARKHYFQTTDDHFAQAASGPASEGGAQSAKKRGAAGARGESRRFARIEGNSRCSNGLCNIGRNAATCKGGWGGIRTPGRLTPTAVFKTAALDRSATHPGGRHCNGFPRACAAGRT